MRAVALAVVMALVAPAAAAVDDEPSVTERDEARPKKHEKPALLDFENGLDVRLEGFDGATTQVDLSSRATVQFVSQWRAVSEADWRDYDRVQWWRSGANLSYDLGWARVTFHAMYDHQENEFGRGQAIDMGVEIVHERKLSKNVTGFVSLMLGQRMWRGRPLPGEQSGGRGMLSIGVRWK